MMSKVYKVEAAIRNATGSLKFTQQRGTALNVEAANVEQAIEVAKDIISERYDDAEYLFTMSVEFVCELHSRNDC